MTMPKPVVATSKVIQMVKIHNWTILDMSLRDVIEFLEIHPVVLGLVTVTDLLHTVLTNPVVGVDHQHIPDQGQRNVPSPGTVAGAVIGQGTGRVPVDGPGPGLGTGPILGAVPDVGLMIAQGLVLGHVPDAGDIGVLDLATPGIDQDVEVTIRVTLTHQITLTGEVAAVSAQAVTSRTQVLEGG